MDVVDDLSVSPFHVVVVNDLGLSNCKSDVVKKKNLIFNIWLISISSLRFSLCELGFVGTYSKTIIASIYILLQLKSLPREQELCSVT